VVSLFRRRRRPRANAPHITPRSEAIAVARVELEDLTPPTDVYLGQLAYLTLILFENLSRAVILAPTTQAKTSLSRATAEVLEAHESLITEMRGAGIDPITGLAAGLPSGLSQRVSLLLDIDKGQDALVNELRAAIEASPRLASRLAMWGRRLVGDTMLVARSSLAIGGQLPGEERIEPVFTELISAHTRRMDVLGLTA
jgi:hypothetical protein